MHVSAKFSLGRGRLGRCLAAGLTLVLVVAASWSIAGQLSTSAQTAAAALDEAQAADAGPKAYVGLFKDNAVAVVDLATNSVRTTIPVPAGPHGLVVTPDGLKAYVSSDGDSTVSVIDTATDRIAKTIDVGPTPHGLAISRDGRQMLVSGFGSNQAEVVDTASDSVTQRYPIPQPHNSAFSPDGRTAYVGSQQQASTALVVLDLADSVQVASVPLPSAPRALNMSPDGTRLYFTLAGVDAVQVFDPASRQIVGSIDVGASPHQPIFTPDGKLALVQAQGPGELALIDPGQNSVLATLKLGTMPHWIGVTSDSRLAYATNEGSNDVSVVDLASQRVVTTIPVGNGPRKIAVQPGAVAAPAGSLAAQGASSGAAPQRSLGSVLFSDHGVQDISTVAEADVEVDDYYFQPTFLQGAPGQTMTLTIENDSGTLHNFSLASQGIDVDVPPKGEVEVQVAFPSSGAVRYFCKFHAALGMNGELLLTGDSPAPPSGDTVDRTNADSW